MKPAAISMSSSGSAPVRRQFSTPPGNWSGLQSSRKEGIRINSDFKDLLRAFSGVRYLIVGGYAVMRYSEPHYTKDLGLWIDSTPVNAANVVNALRAFGAPVEGVSAFQPTLSV